MLVWEDSRTQHLLYQSVTRVNSPTVCTPRWHCEWRAVTGTWPSPSWPARVRRHTETTHTDDRSVCGKLPPLQTLKFPAPVMEFMYFVFTRMPDKSYRGRLRSLLSCLCDVFRALISSLVCLFFVSTWFCLFSIRPFQQHKVSLQNFSFSLGLSGKRISLVMHVYANTVIFADHCC